jgi:uncharacterized protein with FMN-binding domain
VRSATKTFVGLAGIGVLVATAKLGLPTTTATAAVTTSDNSTASSNTDTAAPASTTPTTTTTTATTKKHTSTKTATNKKTTTKKATTGSTTGGTTSTTPSTSPAGVSGTKTGTAYESIFGSNIQISVTKSNGKITAVNCIVCEATGGRQGAFPSLIQATIDANGTGFGNLSRATYTTSAFKKAVKAALAKF